MPMVIAKAMDGIPMKITTPVMDKGK